MKRAFLSLLMAVALIGSIWGADTDLSTVANGIYVSNKSVLPNTSATLSIQMKNSTSGIISGFTFNLAVPTGATFSSAALSSSRAATSNFTFSANGTKNLFVTCYSGTSSTFSGTSGEVATLTLTSPTMPGDYTVSVSNITLATRTGGEIEIAGPINTTLHVHNLVATASKAATCTATGNKAYWTCSGCRKVYSNANATTETTVSAMTIAAIGHSYTYTPNGETSHTKACSRCSSMTSENHILSNGSCTLCKLTPVTGISLDKTSAKLLVGNTVTLTATVNPSTATNKNVSWSSSDATVASVSTSGVVTAKKTGTATITATAGTKKATCSVTVILASSNIVQGKNGVTTFTSAIPFLAPASVKTYYAKVESVDGMVVAKMYAIKQGTIVAAGEGVIFYDPEETEVPITVNHTVQNGQTISDNALVGVLNDDGSNLDGNGFNYVLGTNKTTGLTAFFLYTGKITPLVGKAYLHSAAELSAASRVIFEDEEEDNSTLIIGIEDKKATPTNSFDLYGRLSNMQKGLLIKDGKVIMKK